MTAVVNSVGENVTPMLTSPFPGITPMCYKSKTSNNAIRTCIGINEIA